MCLQLILFIIQCVNAYPYKDYIIAYIPVEELGYLTSAKTEALPLPYYSNPFLYNPWHIQRQMEPAWSPYTRTTGPVTFGGQVKAKGSVSVTGRFGNDGYNKFASYSAPPTPIAITSSPTLSTGTTLPTITKLPEVILPTTFNVPITANKPSTLSVPETPMPFILATTTVPLLPVESSNVGFVSDTALDANMPVARTMKFSGMVPASGRVRICANFC